ncbi:MAG TPA: hypothetical protein PLP14_04460 [Chitinophagaceae bacterium]|nr:hypothetical protein [Chitinophagaceae bacterium]
MKGSRNCLDEQNFTITFDSPMKSSWFKAVCYAILSVVVFLWVLPAFTTFRIQIHQYLMRENLQETYLPEQLIYSSTEWQKINPSEKDEISINGKMFDVGSVLHKGDQVYIRGCFDEAEDELISGVLRYFLKEPFKHAGFSLMAFAFLFFEDMRVSIPDTCWMPSLPSKPRMYYLLVPGMEIQFPQEHPPC